MHRPAMSLFVVAIALLAILLVGCSDETAPTSTATHTPEPTSTSTPEPTPVVLGQCQNGMTLQPGEGCTYTGGGTPPATVVLSVTLDGSICREGSRPKLESGNISINIGNLRLCGTAGFERDDAFQSDIVVNSNADGSWTYYKSAPSASPTDALIPTAIPTQTPTATPTPVPTATPTPEPTPQPTAIPTPTPVPTAMPTPEPTPQPTATPASTPLPTATPRLTATPGPTATPWPTATPEPTANPTAAPVVTLPVPTKVPIILGDLNWESAQLQNRIAQYIIEHGYGHPTSVVPGTTALLFDGLQRGDIDVFMEVWLPGQKQAWDKALSEGEVLEVGRSLGSDWQSAFVIPAYLQQQYMDLDSIEDLKDPQFKRLFQTTESGDKARLVSCPVTWACARTNAAQIAGYGLEDHVHVVNPVSEAARNADLYGAYERREPWLGYQWGTNDPALTLDLIRLEEPAYSDECWSTTKACAYEDATILIAVNTDLPVEAPGVVAMLGKWDFNIEVYRAVVRWQSAAGVTDPTSTAIWWLESNPEIWSAWVTDEAVANVQTALDRGETAAGWSRVRTLPDSAAAPTPTATPNNDGPGGICRVGLIVGPGENCTYPGTSTEFSVDPSGSGRFLFFHRRNRNRRPQHDHQRGHVLLQGQQAGRRNLDH